jgi:bacterioferritin (cytochrome b1)
LQIHQKEHQEEPHMHEHEGHPHSHSRSAQNREEVEATLRYMLQHNDHHVTELRELAHELQHLAMPERAEEVLRAVLDYESGNAKLKQTLELIKELGTKVEILGF